MTIGTPSPAMFTHLWQSAVRRPVATILAAAALTLAAGTGMARLELRTDGQALVPQHSPEVQFDRQIRRTFDIEDQLAVVIESEHPQGILNPGTLRLVADLTRELGAVEGIDPKEVTSLATERSQRGGAGALDFKPFLYPFPESAQEIGRIRADLAGMRIYTGTLISGDGSESGAAQDWSPSAAAILIGVEPGADRTLIHRRVGEVVAAQGVTSEKIHIVGAPIAESLLGRHILEDLSTLVPIAVLLMSFIFYLRYRSLAAVLLPMTEVAACLVFVFGVMGHVGVPVSLTITVLPVILTAIGVADEIHIFDRYARLLSHRVDNTTQLGTLLQTMHEMWRPVVKTSITTSIAFLSFTLSPIPPVRHFGIFTAAGVLFCMLWSLTVIPACLGLICSTAFSAVRAGAWPQRFARLRRVRPRRRTVLAMMALAALFVSFGLQQLTVQDSWIGGFARTSAFRQSTETVNRLFHGTHILLVCFDTRPGGLSGDLQPIVPGIVQLPERFQLLVPSSDQLNPAALVGEQVLIRAAPLERVARNWETSLAGSGRGRRANLSAAVVAAEPEGNRIRIEMVPALDPARKRFLTSRPGRRWSFSATGERLLDPRMLEHLRKTSDFIAGRLAEGGGGVLGPQAQISVVRYILWGGKEEERRIDDTPLKNRYLLSIFRRVRGQERVEEVIDGAHQQALITVFLKNANFIAVGRLMEAIREYALAELAPLGVRVGFAGDVAVSQAMIGAIITTQTISLLLSLAGILLVAGLLGRSVWLGVLCLLPPALAVLINFSMMGAAGIPLGVATSMFSAMTIGIGVDFAIHLTERYRFSSASVLSRKFVFRVGESFVPLARRADAGILEVFQGIATQPAVRRAGQSDEERLRQGTRQSDHDKRLGEALAVTGPAILMNTIVIAVGFGVMMLSQVPANGWLGLFVVSSVVTCFLATLFVLPPLFELRRLRPVPHSNGVRLSR